MLCIRYRQQGETEIHQFQSAKSELTLGRNRNCDLVLSGHGISSQHCKISLHGKNIQLEDLGSTNGTYVNRAKITQAISLGQDDQIQIANYWLQVSWQPGETPSIQAPPPAAPTSTSTTKTAIEAPPFDSAPPADWPQQHAKLHRKAQFWDSRDRSPQLLLSSVQLTPLLSILNYSGTLFPPLDDLDRAYLEASAQKQTRKRRQRKIVAAVLGSISLLMLLLVLLRAQCATPTPEEASDLPLAQTNTVDSSTNESSSETNDAPADRAQEPSANDSPQQQIARARLRSYVASARMLLESTPRQAALLTLAALDYAKEQRIDDSELEPTLREALNGVRGQNLGQHQGFISDAIWHPQGLFAISASGDRSVGLWFAPTGEFKRLQGHQDWIRSVAISPEGQWFASASEDRSIRIWSLQISEDQRGYKVEEAQVLNGHGQGVVQVCALSDRQLLSVDLGGSVKVWSGLPGAATARNLADLGTKVSAVACPQAKSPLAIATAQGQIHLWQQNGASLASQGILHNQGGAAHAIAVGAKGNWLLAAVAQGPPELWNLAAPEAPFLLPGHKGKVSAVEISPDERYAVTTSQDFTLHTWNLWAQKPADAAVVFPGHQAKPTALRITRDSKALISADESGQIYVWNLERKDFVIEKSDLGRHAQAVQVLALSPSNELLSGGKDGALRRWDPRSSRAGANAQGYRVHRDALLSLALDDSQTQAIVTSADNSASLWTIENPQSMRMRFKLDGHQKAVTSAAFSPDGSFAATGSEDQNILLWHLAGAQNHQVPSLRLVGHGDSIVQLAFSKDSRWLISASQDYSLRIWDLRTPKPNQHVRALRGHKDAISVVRLLPERNQIVSASIDGEIRLWSLLDPDPQATVVRLRGHTDSIWGLAYSPDEHWLASAGGDRKILVWDLETPGSAPESLLGHKDSVNALVFAKHPRVEHGDRPYILASGSSDMSVRIWDLNRSDPSSRPQVLEGHQAAVHFVQVLDDGRIISGSNDKNIGLWDLHSGRNVMLQGHDGVITGLRASPARHAFLSTSYDGSLRLWPTELSALKSLACNMLPPSLDSATWQRYLDPLPYREICAR